MLHRERERGERKLYDDDTMRWLFVIFPCNTGSTILSVAIGNSQNIQHSEDRHRCSLFVVSTVSDSLVVGCPDEYDPFHQAGTIRKKTTNPTEIATEIVNHKLVCTVL